MCCIDTGRKKAHSIFQGMPTDPSHHYRWMSRAFLLPSLRNRPRKACVSFSSDIHASHSEFKPCTTAQCTAIASSQRKRLIPRVHSSDQSPSYGRLSQTQRPPIPPPGRHVRTRHPRTQHWDRICLHRKRAQRRRCYPSERPERTQGVAATPSAFPFVPLRCRGLD